MCVLNKRYDPSANTTTRWSLTYDEICYCKRVVAPTFISQESCGREEDRAYSDNSSCNLWFVDNPTPLKQPKNWNKEALFRLLQRDKYCGEFENKVYFVYHITHATFTNTMQHISTST